ncbi:MAG TPA: DUF3052 domain-containing protein [Gemmatirosa sp.]
MPGYSGTPLARKLGLKPGHRAVLLGAPDGFAATLAPLPDGAIVASAPADAAPSVGVDVVVLFGREAAALRTTMPALAAGLPRGGALWVAWPKRAARQATDLTDGVVREIGLGTGLVDVKVCAVSDVWSGLKFVHRRGTA